MNAYAIRRQGRGHIDTYGIIYGESREDVQTGADEYLHSKCGDFEARLEYLTESQAEYQLENGVPVIGQAGESKETK